MLYLVPDWPAFCAVRCVLTDDCMYRLGWLQVYANLVQCISSPSRPETQHMWRFGLQTSLGLQLVNFNTYRKHSNTAHRLTQARSNANKGRSVSMSPESSIPAVPPKPRASAVVSSTMLSEFICTRMKQYTKRLKRLS